MTTVKELIEKLKEYPEDTVVSADGVKEGVAVSLVPVDLVDGLLGTKLVISKKERNKEGKND